MAQRRELYEAGEQERALSMSDEEHDRSFEIEDERWSRKNQIRDWLKLALLIAIALAYQLLIFFLEPGLR